MKKNRYLLVCAASILTLTLPLAPMLAQAQMNSYGGCGHMDSMGYGQTAPPAGWAVQPGGHEHVSLQPVQAKSSKRAFTAKKHGHQGYSGFAAPEHADHAGHALQRVNQTGPPVM